MKVMVMIEGSGADEDKIAPTEEMLREMGAYNEQLVKAGIMLDGQGLHPSSKGAQVVFEGGVDHGRRRALHRVEGDHRRLLGLGGQLASRRPSSGPSVARPIRSSAGARCWRCGRSSPTRTSVPSTPTSCGSGTAPEEIGRRRSSSPASDDGRPQPHGSRPIWRIESPRLIATLARLVRDVGLAEELAQDAFVARARAVAGSGVPDNPGGWLTATAKHKAIDAIRRERNPGRQVRPAARPTRVQPGRRSPIRSCRRPADRRRPACPDLRGLPPGAAAAVPGRADAAAARRTVHR